MTLFGTVFTVVLQRLGGHRQEAVASEAEPLHNSPNSEHLRFRKRTVVPDTYELRAFRFATRA